MSEARTRGWYGWCADKERRSYHTRRDALRELIRAREERPSTVHKERGFYQCEACGGWHLTSIIQKNPDNNAPEVREKMLKLRRDRKAKRS